LCKANTKLILAEEDNIQHILASLALTVTQQSVIIAKLSSYPRKNRTKKALWELDNLRRSLHLLNYVDSPQFQRNIQRALNRGESYHKLVRAVAYANGGKLRVRTDQEQQLWSECSRLLANCIIYYNACILSELLERAERKQDYQRADAIKRANPASWKHVSLYPAFFIGSTGCKIFKVYRRYVLAYKLAYSGIRAERYRWELSRRLWEPLERGFCPIAGRLRRLGNLGLPV